MLGISESDDLDWSEGLFDSELLVGFPMFVKCPLWTRCLVLDKGGAWIALDRLPASQDRDEEGIVMECFRQAESVGLYKKVPNWNEVLIEDLTDGEDFQGFPCKLALVPALLAIPSSSVAVTIDGSGTIESWDVKPERRGLGWVADGIHTKLLLGETEPVRPVIVDRQTLENIDFFKYTESYTIM